MHRVLKRTAVLLLIASPGEPSAAPPCIRTVAS
jgi:hypothetical protein